MSANTSPDNITYPVSTDAVAPLETVFATMASSIQTALTNRNTNEFLIYATLSALNAVPGTVIGQHAYVNADGTASNNGDYYWNGTSWVWNGIYGASLTANTGWTAGTGNQTPRALMVGKLVTLFGTLTWAGGGAYSSIVTVPAVFRPPTTAARPIGTATQITGSSLLNFQTSFNGSTGILGNGTGGTGSLPASGSVFLNGLSWVMD